MSRYHFDDFTVANYRRLLRETKSKYKFITYKEAFSADVKSPCILWRHDLDASVHRARALAEIESELGVRASYFVQLSCTFYNVFEADVKNHLFEISRLGHDIGLHFDPSCYSISTSDELKHWLDFEKRTLEGLLQKPVEMFSFHVPTTVPHEFLRQEYGGMINVYGPQIVDGFKYCSDSNGYWRHERFETLLDPETYPRLHLLTHPEYWTDEVMSPYERIERCLAGRAKSTMTRLDDIVSATGRMIPKQSDEERA